MSKSKFFLLLPFLVFLFTSCETSNSYKNSNKGFAPTSLSNYVIEFYTYKVSASFNEVFYRKTATYHFADNGHYKLYIGNALHTSGNYAYRKTGPDKGDLLVSYSGHAGNLEYIIVLDFTSPEVGSLHGSNHQSGSLDAFEANFKVVSPKKSSSPQS